jgi:hypothetical protein
VAVPADGYGVMFAFHADLTPAGGAGRLSGHCHDRTAGKVGSTCLCAVSRSSLVDSYGQTGLWASDVVLALALRMRII